MGVRKSCESSIERKVMMMTTVNDVASAVLGSFNEPISTMKLQKLVYLAQGWNLALRGQPMFDSKFEAWVNGPVNRELFREHRTRYSISTWPEGDAENLSESDRIVLAAVIQNYGALSGRELSELTHVSGTPWAAARLRAGVGANQSSTQELDIDEMREHFEKLLLSGAREMPQLDATH